MDILVNNETAEFTIEDFPMLISGVGGTGVSFFSICLMANLLNSGKKILFFSAYPAAKEELRKQIKSEENAIIIDSGEEQDFINFIENTSDLNERIILVKNFDLYSLDLFEIIKKLKLVVFAGNIDNCLFSDEIINKNFVTKIFFSQSEKYPQGELINLPKYNGKIVSDRYNGLISLTK